MYRFLLDVKNRTPFIDQLIFAVYELHIPEDELLDMELFHFQWILDGFLNQQKRLDARNANLMCLIANCHRSKNTKAFVPKDFMPKPPKTDKELGNDILSAFGVK